MKKMLCMLLAVFSLSLIAETSPGRVLLSEFKSDFLCLVDDPSGIGSDEGYSLTLPSDEFDMPEVRFVEGAWVKYPLHCVVEAKEDSYAYLCGFPMGDNLLILDFFKDSLTARGSYFGEYETEEMTFTCKTNR